MIESLLIGGRTAARIVRVGDTVRRPLRPRSGFSQALLELLSARNFEFAPRFLGIDGQGREILSFIDGVVVHEKITWTNSQLIVASQMLRGFHDATMGSELARESDVVCHNDFAPWNLVLREGSPVGIIDFDDAAPGARLDDLAYFLWTFLDLGDDLPIDEQARKLRLVREAYGTEHTGNLMDAVLAQQRRILAFREHLAITAVDAEIRHFSKSRIAAIRAQIEWMLTNCEKLKATFL